MKSVFPLAIFISCSLGVLVLIYELINCIGVMDQINKKQVFLPFSSKAFQMASENSDFLGSQSKAIARRISSIPVDIIKHILVVLISLLILNQNIKKRAERGISSIVGTFPKLSSSSKLKEISFVSSIITMLTAVVFSGGPILYKPSRVENEIFLSVMVYCALAFIFIPCIYIVFRKLLKVYSGRLIAAFYLAYYVKSISEFLTVDDVNLKSMKKLNITQFSTSVVDYLNERHLEKRVYGERKKSETLNAALVGWGSLERIEIYGNHKDLSSREFESVLMHEIGHSQDYSLFKKLGVLFTVKFIEMIIIFQLYFSVSEEYSDEFISKYGTFSIVGILYFLFMDRWLLLFHKLTSQTAENNADLIAKAHGYGDDLAKVLFNITVKGETSIQSTWFYNALRSYHPTVYERIENLKS